MNAIKAMKNKINLLVAIHNSKRWVEWFKNETPGHTIGRYDCCARDEDPGKNKAFMVLLRASE